MRSKSAFYIVFWLAGSLFVLGYFSIKRFLTLDAKYVICFSVSAFSISVSSFLSQMIDEYEIHKFVKVLIDLANYMFMGIAIFSLVVFPFIIANRDFSELSNGLILWSLALIFLSTVVKDIKWNLFSKERSKDNTKEFKNKAEKRMDNKILESKGDNKKGLADYEAYRAK